MFSAARLIAAVAVVALGAGTLLFAAISDPANGPAASPTPSLTLREVERGVMKVIDDGAGHGLDGMPLAGVATGPDGPVWLLRASGRDGQVTGLLTMGEPGITGGSRDVDIFVAPDGKLRGVSASGRLDVFDGGVWTVEAVPPREARDVLVAGDGTIWAAWIEERMGEAGRPEAGYLGPDGWHTIDSSASPATYVQFSQSPVSQSLAVTPDGEAWLGVDFYHDLLDESHWRGLLRAGESGWVVEHPVGERDDLSAGPMAVGPDGTLWVYLATRGRSGAERYLARRHEDGWTVFSTDDGVPPLALNQQTVARLAVAKDGTLWIAFDGDVPVAALSPHAPGDCPGVLSFDGTTWRQYLEGTCINHVAFAPDGAVYATARTGQSDDSVLAPNGTVTDFGTREVPELAGLYVIDPSVATPPAP